MVDLFGLKKDSETSSSDNPTPPARPSDSGEGKTQQRLWAVLLVIDSIFVIVFGGAVAAKVYQHLKAPMVLVAAQPGRHKPAKPPATQAEAAPAQPAKAAAPEAPASAPPPQAKPEPAEAQQPLPKAGNGLKAPKPALLAEPPRHREAAKPQAASQTTQAGKPEPAQPSSAAEDKRRSVPVEFRIRATRAKNVRLAGAFIVRGGHREMVHRGEGVWTLTLYLLPGTNYRYWFLVDGKKTLDPDNDKTERGASVLTLP
ncbi:MAG TPA: hypothetical protein DEB40_03675 [Elusimicrobia bacterium]|nr:hypothetical protein [Elusimicrobiota bacterium]HBT60826.1 hypothetical protein [Elusimicrobiota bacterium]